MLTSSALRVPEKVAVVDTLGLENSIARARTLAYLAMTSIKLLETGELEERLAFLENASQTQKTLPVNRRLTAY